MCILNINFVDCPSGAEFCRFPGYLEKKKKVNNLIA